MKKMDKVDTCIDHNYTDKRKSFERLTQWFSTVFYLRHTIFMDKVLQHTKCKKTNIQFCLKLTFMKLKITLHIG